MEEENIRSNNNMKILANTHRNHFGRRAPHRFHIDFTQWNRNVFICSLILFFFGRICQRECNGRWGNYEDFKLHFGQFHFWEANRVWNGIEWIKRKAGEIKLWALISRERKKEKKVDWTGTWAGAMYVKPLNVYNYCHYLFQTSWRRRNINRIWKFIIIFPFDNSHTTSTPTFISDPK